MLVAVVISVIFLAVITYDCFSRAKIDANGADPGYLDWSSNDTPYQQGRHNQSPTYVVDKNAKRAGAKLIFVDSVWYII